MQFKVQYRAPRPGEVLRFLNVHASHVSCGENLDIRFSPCPTCARDKPKHTSNTINTQTGLWYCWSCQARGNWFTLTRAFGAPLDEADRFAEGSNWFDGAKIKAGSASMHGAGERRPIIDGHYPDLLRYCYSRGFTNETLDAWRVSSKGPKNLRWPIYAWTETGWDIVNARLRVVLDREAAGTKDWFEVKGGETGLMLGNHLLDLANTDGRVIITEGQWDAMTAYQIGLRNVFSLPNGAAHVNVAQMLRYIPDSWEVWLAVDMDKHGDQCAEAFFAQLGPDRLARIHMPHKDLNAWLLADPTLTPAKVMSTAKGFTHLVAKQAVKASGSSRYLQVGKRIPDEAKPKPLCDTPWDGLTRLLDGGLKTHQTTGLLAPSGQGKTTVVNQWGIHVASRGIRTGLISLEGDRDSLADKLSRAVEGYCGQEAMASVAENLLISPLEGNRVTWQQAIKELEEMAHDGCKLLILDNLDFIMPRSNLNAANQQKVEAYGRIVELARSIDVHILVVWQPFKIDSGVIVNSGQQKGASQLLQDADNYLNLNRVDGLARLEVEKCRDMGLQDNRFVWTLYSPLTRCLAEVQAPTGAVGGAVDTAHTFGVAPR